jgi:hypothetical protein
LISGHRERQDFLLPSAQPLAAFIHGHPGPPVASWSQKDVNARGQATSSVMNPVSRKKQAGGRIGSLVKEILMILVASV